MIYRILGNKVVIVTAFSDYCLYELRQQFLFHPSISKSEIQSLISSKGFEGYRIEIERRRDIIAPSRGRYRVYTNVYRKNMFGSSICKVEN